MSSFEKWEYKLVNKPLSEVELNRLGFLRWEMVQFIPGRGYYFKRLILL